MKLYQYSLALVVILLLFYFGFCWSSLKITGEDEMKSMAIEHFIKRQDRYNAMIFSNYPDLFLGEEVDSFGEVHFKKYKSELDFIDGNPNCCRYYHYSDSSDENQDKVLYSSFDHFIGLYKGKVVMDVQVRWVDKYGEIHKVPLGLSVHFTNCGVHEMF